MKVKPDEHMETQFFAFMDGMNDIFEDLPDGAYGQAMQESITSETGWNAQNYDTLDGYDGFMYWVRNTWIK